MFVVAEFCKYCFGLKLAMFVLKAQKPPQKPSPASASSAPVVKDTLVKKTELKAKPDTTSTFQAFKRTELKVCVELIVALCLRFMCYYYLLQLNGLSSLSNHTKCSHILAHR